MEIFSGVHKSIKTHILHQNQPGGGAVSPLTPSELLQRGNTLQLRAAGGGGGGGGGGGEKDVYSARVYLYVSLGLSPPICFHSSPLSISQT